MQIDAGDTIITTTTTSYESVDSDLASKKKTNKYVFLFSLSLFLICTIALVVFFPFTFIREKNFSVNGNVNLNSSDFLKLSKANKMDSWIMADTNKLKNNIQTEASALISNCEFDNSSFFPTLYVDEKIPRAKIFGNVYLDVNNTFEQTLEDVDKIDLEKDSIERIKKQLNDEKDKIPTVVSNIKDDTGSIDEKNRVIENSIQTLKNLNLKALSTFQYLNFSFENLNVKYLDVVLNYDKHNYLIENVNVSKFDAIFSQSAFPDSIMSSLNKEKDNAQEQIYKLYDDKTTIFAYNVSVNIDESTNSIRFILNNE